MTTDFVVIDVLVDDACEDKMDGVGEIDEDAIVNEGEVRERES